MAEYPKQIEAGQKVHYEHGDKGRVYFVVGPHPEVPHYWVVVPSGHSMGAVIASEEYVSPVPSPDDPVEVVVKMTRGLRDLIIEGASVTVDGDGPLIVACRASKEAEARD